MLMYQYRYSDDANVSGDDDGDAQLKMASTSGTLLPGAAGKNQMSA